MIQPSASLSVPSLWIVLGVGACGSQADHVGQRTREACPNVDGQGVWTATAGSAWQLVEVGRITGPDHDTPFGEVIDLAVDHTGRIFVLDPHHRQIHVYDDDRNHLRTLGRPGEGPGELSRPGGLRTFGDSLLVVDFGTAAYSIFDSSGSSGRRLRRPVTGASLPWRGTVTRHGEIIDVDQVPFSGGRRQRIGLIREGVFETLFVVPPPPENEVRLGGGRLGLGLPYAPQLHWALDPGGRWIWIGNSEQYRIERIDLETGDVLVFALELRRADVTATERNAALDWMREAATAQGIPATEIRAGWIPHQKPAFNGFVADGDGYLWVQPILPARGRVADIFDPTGCYLGRIATPFVLNAPTPPVIVGSRVYAVVRDQWDRPEILVARIMFRDTGH